MKISELRNSRFLTKDDCEPPIKVTVRNIEQVDVAMEGQKPELRWAMNFQEDCKPMVLNSINAQVIAMITKSEETDDWGGAVIVLYNDPTVSFGGKIVGGIRVRAPRLPQAQIEQARVQPPREAGPERVDVESAITRARIPQPVREPVRPQPPSFNDLEDDHIPY